MYTLLSQREQSNGAEAVRRSGNKVFRSVLFSKIGGTLAHCVPISHDPGESAKLLLEPRRDFLECRLQSGNEHRWTGLEALGDGLSGSRKSGCEGADAAR